MVPVAADHAPDVVDGNVLPSFVSDMLPARNLFQNQKADFVAGIKEMTRLWIMRGADNVALELVAQNLRVATLRTSWHGLPDPGKGLMTIEPAQLDDLAVQLEAVIGELGLTEGETAGVFVHDLRSAAQAHPGRVEVSFLQIPQSDSVQTLKVCRMCDRLVLWCRGWQWQRSFRNYVIAVEQFDFDRQRIFRGFQMLYETINIDRRALGEHVLRPHEDVLDKRRWYYAERDLAVDAAERKIVNLVSKGWNIGALRGIDIHGEHILAVEVEVGRQFKREGRVSTFVFSEALSVDPDR